MNYLKKNNIYCNISYPFPIHSMKGYRHLNKKKVTLKNTERLSKEIFSLPMYPELSNKNLENVIKVLRNY